MLRRHARLRMFVSDSHVEFVAHSFVFNSEIFASKGAQLKACWIMRIRDSFSCRVRDPSICLMSEFV